MSDSSPLLSLGLVLAGGLSYLLYKKMSCECHHRREQKKTRGKGKGGVLDIVGDCIKPLESVVATPEAHQLQFVKNFQGPVGKTGYMYQNPHTHVLYVGFAPIPEHMKR